MIEGGHEPHVIMYHIAAIVYRNCEFVSDLSRSIFHNTVIVACGDNIILISSI